MSTPKDVLKLLEAMQGMPMPGNALYLGPRECTPLYAVRTMWPNLVTLDKDREVRPDVIADLDGVQLILDNYDACIASYVLMYLEHPVRALRKLVRACKYVLLQENVVRLRGNKDPCRNRFVCPAASTAVRVDAIHVAAKEGRRLIDLVEFGISYVHYYHNGDGCISAVWRLHECGSGHHR